MNIKIIIYALVFLLLFTELIAQDNTYEEWYLTTRDSLELYVREIKNEHPRDTVIVLHGGFGASHDYMLDAIKGLEKDHHFIFYDQRGSVLSPAPVEKLTFNKNVEDLNELIDELGVKKAKLMCHSIGTLVAMEFLKRYPNKVTNLVLISAILPKSAKYEDVFSDRVFKTVQILETRKEYLQLIEPYKRRFENLSDKELTEYWRIQFANYNIYKVERWPFVKGGKAYYKKEAAIMGKGDIWNYDYRDILSQHKKVVYIQGDKDFLDLNAEVINDLLQPFPAIHLNIVKDAGHLIWIDQPELFKLQLKQALK